LKTHARLAVTGYPTRPELGQWDRESARSHFNLSSNLPVLLIAGGSKGARSINQPVFAALPALLAMAQVIHITGSLDKEAAEAARAGLPADLQARYHIYDYLHEDMGAALAAADLAVTRAGASTLGEYPLFGLPAILVPYQFAWRYQKVNADYLQQKGTALILEAGQLADELLPTLRSLFAEPQRLQAMRQAMLSLARPNAAGEIAGMLQDLAGEPLGKRGAQSW
jgi:UDP-N-acetylglucosamine--N-acetylmuramyl-(pentapeptide) pyrophosphoryl-undecaprenol N-acetylglucosamine transferase